MAFTCDQLFEAAAAISYYRAEIACTTWNRLDGSRQGFFLQVANGSSHDLNVCAENLMNQLINY